MKKILSNNKGFSLIELIVVIAILGVLVGVAAPNLIGYVEKSRVSADIANVENVQRASEAYVAENDDKTGDITDDVAKASFNNALPELKSTKAKGLAKDGIKVNVTGQVVTMTPSVSALQAK